MNNLNIYHNYVANALITVWCKILTVENIDEFDEFSAIRQYFPIKIFHLVCYFNTVGDPAPPEIKLSVGRLQR